MLSEDAAKLFEKWAEEMENCDPDNFDMYIYNGKSLPHSFTPGTRTTMLTWAAWVETQGQILLGMASSP